MDETKRLVLVKGGERYVFRYRAGEETRVIDVFAEMAADHTSEFDWFDAAVLSYQMGRQLERELDEMTA
jgi:hypothetical protein